MSENGGEFLREVKVGQKGLKGKQPKQEANWVIEKLIPHFIFLHPHQNPTQVHRHTPQIHC